MPAKELTIVVPTFNENDNVEELIALLEKCLDGIEWEVVFVDDNSPDGTAEHAFTINREKPDVRCIRRVGRRGVFSFCTD